MQPKCMQLLQVVICHSATIFSKTIISIIDLTMTLSIKILGATTLSVMTFSIMTITIITFRTKVNKMRHSA
jgi:hypothetical protein